MISTVLGVKRWVPGTVALAACILVKSRYKSSARMVLSQAVVRSRTNTQRIVQRSISRRGIHGHHVPQPPCTQPASRPCLTMRRLGQCRCAGAAHNKALPARQFSTNGHGFLCTAPIMSYRFTDAFIFLPGDEVHDEAEQSLCRFAEVPILEERGGRTAPNGCRRHLQSEIPDHTQ